VAARCETGNTSAHRNQGWIRSKVPAFVKSRRRTLRAFIRGETSRVKRRMYSKRREAESFAEYPSRLKSILARSPKSSQASSDATDTWRRTYQFRLIVARQVLFSAAVSSRANLALADKNSGMETAPSSTGTLKFTYYVRWMAINYRWAAVYTRDRVLHSLLCRAFISTRT